MGVPLLVLEPHTRHGSVQQGKMLRQQLVVVFPDPCFGGGTQIQPNTHLNVFFKFIINITVFIAKAFSFFLFFLTMQDWVFNVRKASPPFFSSRAPKRFRA